MRSLIYNARLVATMDDRGSELAEGYVLVDGDRIDLVGRGTLPSRVPVDVLMDARGRVILPGLVNTHHHLFQTLTRNVPTVQEAPLFRWLTELYQIWRNIDAETLDAAVRPNTLRSLAQGGFDRPHIFIDGLRSPPASLDQYECTCHSKRLRTAGNWALTAWELYILNPIADRYAIFQDDLICYRNLRDYLEMSKYPHHGYLNLYTFPSNEQGKGWHLSNQRGLGAVALVFKNEALRLLYGIQHFINRPMDRKRGDKSIDGGIIEAFKKVQWREYVHSGHRPRQSSRHRGLRGRARRTCSLTTSPRSSWSASY